MKALVYLKNSLYQKLLGLIIKKGKKTKAKGLLVRACKKLIIKTNYSLSYIFLKIFSKLNSIVEVKTVSVKRSQHIVPFSINLKRRVYLIIKWLLLAVLENTKKISLSDKIYEEMLNIVTNMPSKAIKLKTENFQRAYANRSNIHFRW